LIQLTNKNILTSKIKA